jgi:hypothetical protein
MASVSYSYMLNCRGGGGGGGSTRITESLKWRGGVVIIKWGGGVGKFRGKIGKIGPNLHENNEIREKFGKIKNVISQFHKMGGSL